HPSSMQSPTVSTQTPSSSQIAPTGQSSSKSQASPIPISTPQLVTEMARNAANTVITPLNLFFVVKVTSSWKKAKQPNVLCDKSAHGKILLVCRIVGRHGVIQGIAETLLCGVVAKVAGRAFVVTRARQAADGLRNFGAKAIVIAEASLALVVGRAGSTCDDV